MFEKCGDRRKTEFSGVWDRACLDYEGMRVVVVGWTEGGGGKTGVS